MCDDDAVCLSYSMYDDDAVCLSYSMYDDADAVCHIVCMMMLMLSVI